MCAPSFLGLIYQSLKETMVLVGWSHVVSGTSGVMAPLLGVG